MKRLLPWIAPAVLFIAFVAVVAIRVHRQRDVRPMPSVSSCQCRRCNVTDSFEGPLVCGCYREPGAALCHCGHLPPDPPPPKPDDPGKHDRVVSHHDGCEIRKDKSGRYYAAKVIPLATNDSITAYVCNTEDGYHWGFDFADHATFREQGQLVKEIDWIREHTPFR